MGRALDVGIGAAVASVASLIGPPSAVIELVVPLTHEVTRVRDGDTITVPPLTERQLVYWANRRPEGVRLLCVQAPERGEPGYHEAARWLQQRLPSGGRVVLRADPRAGAPRRDAFGRLLAFLSTEDGTDLNLGLVQEGLAPADREYDCPRRSEFLAAEDAARAAHRGVWADEDLSPSDESESGEPPRIAWAHSTVPGASQVPARQ